MCLLVNSMLSHSTVLLYDLLLTRCFPRSRLVSFHEP